MIREYYGGLLNLYDTRRDLFQVIRIPKCDMIKLIAQHLPDLPPASFYGTAPNHSRCLHIGNMNPRMTEEDLWSECNVFNTVEDIRIVSQKDRRYAFVYFATTEEAERVRAMLIAKPKWKGAIAFAKKDKIHVPVFGVPFLKLTPLPPHPQGGWKLFFSRFGAVSRVWSDQESLFVKFEDRTALLNAYRVMATEEIGQSIQTTLSLGKRSLPFVYCLKEEDRTMVDDIIKGGRRGEK
ncbi:hypothetical protein WA588_001982 [Blastocystis sp. NMH]